MPPVKCHLSLSWGRPRTALQRRLRGTRGMVGVSHKIAPPRP